MGGGTLSEVSGRTFPETLHRSEFYFHSVRCMRRRRCPECTGELSDEHRRWYYRIAHEMLRAFVPRTAPSQSVRATFPTRRT